MDIILFLLIAIVTILISIKLSYYADVLDKKTNFGGMIIGGILLAGVTSLPELITSISSITLKNPSLALGDILGSNLFNIFIIVFFDIIYLKKRFMNKISPHYLASHFVLIYIYIVIISYFTGDFIGGIYGIGIPTIMIILSFLIYLMVISKFDIGEQGIEYDIHEKNVGYKFLFTSIIMVIISVLLTYSANKITINYPHFSSSAIGASLLGITTSLPEMVSVFALIKIGSYNLAYANIIGSNIINFVILAIGDILLFSKRIYDFYDNDCIALAYLGLAFTIMMIYPVKRQRNLFTFTYIFPSIFITLMYLLFWYIIVIR